MAIPDHVLMTMPAEPLAAIADRIEDADILLCSATDMGSRLISWSTRSVWSHVALAYREKSSRSPCACCLGAPSGPLPPILAPDDEFICSEYVAKCLEQIGIKIDWDANGFLSPGDFAKDPKIHAIARFET